MKNYKRYIVSALLAVIGLFNAAAEELVVNVTTKNPILPPQVMYIMSNPGQYLTLSLSNTTNEQQLFYIGVELHQISPTNDINIIIPGLTMPKEPFVIAPMGVKIMNAKEMCGMFNHVRMQDITMPQELFDNVASGNFGNLPEGKYELYIYVYKWDPTLSSPVLLNNPSQSKCVFDVCYSAQPPAWISPVAIGGEVAELSQEVPLLQWIAPVLNCAPRAAVYTYDIRIVQMLPGQYPELAIENNSVVYQAFNLTMPQCMIPINYVNAMSPAETYAAQITAKTNAAQEGSLGYINVQNDGKSDIKLFRIKSFAAIPELEPEPEPEPEEGDKKGKENIEIHMMGGSEMSDSLYTLRSVKIITPSFDEDAGARKVYTNTNIPVKWKAPGIEASIGERPDTLQFEYNVELFRNDDYAELAEMVRKEPVYKKQGVKILTDTIRWREIEDKVEKGDYLLLRVTPICKNETSLHYTDTTNTIDFALTEHFTRRFFQCANQVDIKNEKPTTLKAKDLKGKTITIGEYELVLDGDLKDLKVQGCFSGTGHVIWEPLLAKWELCVKFDSIAVNTENQVYAGQVVTYAGPNNKMTSAEVVDKLFSDWGIDNLIGDSGIPYASKLEGEVKDKAKSLAENINLEKYYSEVTKGYALIDNLLSSGTVKDVGFPLELPKEINPSPVNIQITTMKFAPTYATMDLIGTFVVPETRATQNQILVFGAPRMCISPKSLIPEGGHVSLLKDFTVKDPSSEYELTFNAPADVLEPEDGCFLAWQENKFAAVNMDIDMKLPNLYKVEGETVTDQNPILNVKALIEKWDNWTADAHLDSFEHESLPGFTFEETEVIIDYSKRINRPEMADFPKDYDFSKAGVKEASHDDWRGMYISNIYMAFPKSFSFDKKRMKLGLKDMFIDKSGCSLRASIDNAIDYSAGKSGSVGGFSFSLDEIFVDVLQNDFRDFGFSGKLEIPLFKGEIDYRCDIFPQKIKDPKKSGFAYVFKTSQIEDLDFSFILGELSLKKELTYFLVEAIDDENGDTKTNVELCVGGTVDIVGAQKINGELKKVPLPLDLHIPGIKFCKMRIANNKSFISQYARELQTRRDSVENAWGANKSDSIANFDGHKVHWWNETKEFVFGEKSSTPVYLSLGRWGYASPEKSIGCFKFALTDYKFNVSKSPEGADLSFRLGGKITFSDDLDISAGTGISIHSKISNIDDISNIKISYDRTQFEDASLEIKTGQFSLVGELKVVDNSDSGDKGYEGSVDISVMDIFSCTTSGGYYDHEGEDGRFSWGWFLLKCDEIKTFKPVVLYGIKGGFYMNCSPTDDEKSAKPNKGAVGVILGLGIKMGDGGTFDGSFDCTVVAKKKRLTTFKFNGKIDCGGMIKTDVGVVYQNDSIDKYFQLDVTVDISADCGVGAAMKELEASLSELQKLNDKFEGYIKTAEQSLNGVLGDKNSTAGKNDYEKNQQKAQQMQNEDKNSDKKSGSSCCTFTINLQLKITFKKEGRTLNSPDWYVYLGVPDPKEQRCKFTLVDFKSKIVTVSIGADAYLCFGSELPNDGQLPPLPENVRTFLDGKQHGDAVSDDISQLNAAQEKAKQEFQKNALDLKLGGGVMLGASVWGYIDVNLGLFYGSMGATMGFDLVVGRLQGNQICMNTGGFPGIGQEKYSVGPNGEKVLESVDHWYGKGQLYAYLYAKFGLNINLGFFKKKIALIDCGIGGVLQCALPNPNYFTGKARIKVRLLDGLININKKFSFECGDKCDLFLGNALDNYILFEHFSIGVEEPEDVEDNKIDPNLSAQPYVVTQSEIGRQISVVDPNYQQRLQESGKIGERESDETVEDLASRRFKFMILGKPMIYEYNTLDDLKKDKNCVDSTAYNQRHVGGTEKQYITVNRFKPNKYYKLKITGTAKELYHGQWEDPQVFDTTISDFKFEKWTQTKFFYFATHEQGELVVEDDADLQPFTKLAYPCKYTNNGPELMYSTENDLVYAQCIDIKHPIIALKDHELKNKAYKQGKLIWRLYELNTPYGAWTSERMLKESDAIWIDNDSVSIITGTTENPGTSNKRLRLALQYECQKVVQAEGNWIDYKKISVYAKNREEAEASAANYMKIIYAQEHGYKYTIQTRAGNVITPGSTAAVGRVPGGGLGAPAGWKPSDIVGAKVVVQEPKGSAVIGKGSNGESAIKKEFRYAVEEDEYANEQDIDIRSGNYGGQKFNLVIYKYHIGSATITVTKDLYNQILYPAWNHSTYRDVYSCASGRNSYYGHCFMASTIQKIESDIAYYRSNGVKLTDIELLGGKNVSANTSERYLVDIKSSTPLVAPNGLYYITQSPAWYLSYLANHFFIGGGYDYDSPKDDCNFKWYSIWSTAISTNFGGYDGALLQNKYHQISDGRLSIDSIMNFTKGVYYKQYNSPYPISRATDNFNKYWRYVGEPGDAGIVSADFELSVTNQINYIRRCYNMCENISKDISSTLKMFSNYKAREVATWVVNHPGNKVYTLPIGSANGGNVKVTIPNKQFAIVYEGSKQGHDRSCYIEKSISPKTNLPTRIQHHFLAGGKYNGYSTYYSTYLYELMYNTPHKSGYTTATIKFDAAKALKLIKKITFRNYRINAWNIKEGRWTVFNSNSYTPIVETNKVFLNTEVQTNPF